MFALVGKPYAFPSNPPQSFDCWTLVKYVREKNGRSCPLPFKDTEAWCVPGALHEAVGRARELWRCIPSPTPLAMAVLSQDHVGVVVPGGVLHALSRNSSVIFTSFSVIRRVWPNAEWWEV